MKTILILESNPRGDLNLNQEIRNLRGVIERSRDRESFDIQVGTAVRPEDLQELMLRHEPQIVHFCGHGSGKAGLIFQDAEGLGKPVTTDALSNLFRLCAEQVECVVLNACYAEVQAREIVKHIDFAIGMQQAIRDDAAQHFSQGFYRALGFGKPVEVAYEWGCNAIQLMLDNGPARDRSAEPQRQEIEVVEQRLRQTAIPEYLKPVLLQRETLRSMQPQVAELPPTREELEGLSRALVQENALEQFRTQVRESFLADHELTQFEEIRLQQVRRNLGLSEAEAAQIVAEEQAPLQQARNEYKEMVVGLIEAEMYPFNPSTQEDLRQLQEHLGLLDAEVARIEQPIFAAVEEERQRQSKARPKAPIHATTQLSNQPKRKSPRRQTPRNVFPRRALLRALGFGGVGLGLVGGWKAVDNLLEARQKGEHQPGSSQSFTQDLDNGIELEMVLIPAGKFTMGSPNSEEGRWDWEGPQHEVSVSKFWMGRFEVTQSQYAAVMDSNPSNFRGDERPVENVSWNDAQEFCKKLSQQTGHQYRLPSEAEWEYACRAGTTTRFHFGPTLSANQANYKGEVSLEKTTNVGQFPANAFGLHDMHGNVGEWCLDRWHDNYSGVPSDGSAWTTAQGEEWYVIRGGSWYIDSWSCRSASRDKLAPDNRYGYLGFRVVRVL